MGSIRYTKITALEDVQKDIEFCTKYGISSGKHLNDTWNVELSDKTIVITKDFVEFCFLACM